MVHSAAQHLQICASVRIQNICKSTESLMNYTHKTDDASKQISSLIGMTSTYFLRKENRQSIQLSICSIDARILFTSTHVCSYITHMCVKGHLFDDSAFSFCNPNAILFLHSGLEFFFFPISSSHVIVYKMRMEMVGRLRREQPRDIAN